MAYLLFRTVRIVEVNHLQRKKIKNNSSQVTWCIDLHVQDNILCLELCDESPTAHMYWQACQSPALQVPYSDQSVRRLLRLRLLVRRVPLGRGCAVDLNHFFSRFNVEVIAELYIKSLSEAYLLFIWSNTAHTSLTVLLWVCGMQ